MTADHASQAVGRCQYIPARDEFETLAGKRVLAVDGCPEILALVVDVLAARGAQVTAVSGGVEAIVKLDTQPFDLIVTELVLPDMDAWGILSFIYHSRSKMANRVLFFTARRFDQAAVAAIRRCGIPCVFKPCNIEELRAAACCVLLSAEPGQAA